ncbi:MAG: class I SAM-dependent rRNA methyltransferase [Candidatus Sericytochromatia bacterium]
MENREARVILKKGREKSIQGRHPWLFSGGISKVEGDTAAGDILSLYDASGGFLAKGFYNPHSQIALRLLSFEDLPIDAGFFRERLQTALRLRQNLIQDCDAMRLVHAEADGLPGLVIDRYADVLSLQLSSLGMSRLRPLLAELLQDLLAPRLMIERSDSGALKEEQMDAFSGILAGEGEPVAVIAEYGVKFEVDALRGQKTGFFLDQRENRRLIGNLAAGKRLLNCFSYTGGFSLHAAKNGATTTSVEISGPAQEQAKANFRLNGLDPAAHRFEKADVFDFLRAIDPETDPYDVIILDPPAFVKQHQHLKQACRAYQDINRIAMRKSLPDGLLLSCSCSHYLDWDLFQKVIFAAAAESGRSVQILQRLGQPVDHPVSLFHPEGEYLKAFLLRVI